LTNYFKYSSWGDYVINELTIDVAECIPGMKVSQDISNNYGAILLHKDTVLDYYTINKLMNLGIEKLKVLEEFESKVITESTVTATYVEKVNEFKTIIKDIGNGKTLDTLKVQTIVNDLQNSFTSVNDIVSNLNGIRSIDEYTYSHSVNVSLLCFLIGSWLNLSPVQKKILSYCGLLHDIGKSKISQEILNKPGPLTPKEYEEMKKHSVLGYKILEANIAISKDVMIGVLLHHEREDGSGYPFGIKGDQISLYAKIISIADVFDAITSDRVYRKRQTPFDVLQMYESEYLTKCNTSILLTFLNRIAHYYIGSRVRLSNDSWGEIVFINQSSISKPMIKLEDSSIIDLSIEKNISIVEIF